MRKSEWEFLCVRSLFQCAPVLQRDDEKGKYTRTQRAVNAITFLFDFDYIFTAHAYHRYDQVVEEECLLN